MTDDLREPDGQKELTPAPSSSKAGRGNRKAHRLKRYRRRKPQSEIKTTVIHVWMTAAELAIIQLLREASPTAKRLSMSRLIALLAVSEAPQLLAKVLDRARDTVDPQLSQRTTSARYLV